MKFLREEKACENEFDGWALSGSPPYLLIAFGAAELYSATKLSLSQEFTLGPGALPVIYSVGLLIFAGMLAIWPSQEAAPDIESSVAGEDEAPCRSGTIGRVSSPSRLSLLFIISIYFVGFFGGTILFSFLYITVVSRWPVLRASAFALIWGGALYYGFDRLLGVQLEPGILFGS